jgi:hypothetical protein
VTFDGLKFDGALTGVATAFTDPNDGGGSGGDFLNVSGNGFGLGSANSVEDNRGFSVHLADANSLTFFADLASNTNIIRISWAAYSGDTEPTAATTPQQTGTLSDISSDSLVTIDPTGSFDWLVVRIDVIDGNFSSGGARVQDFSFTKIILADDQQLNFDVTAVDGDGDTSDSSVIGVHIVGGAGDTYTLDGSDNPVSDNDVIATSDVVDSVIGGDGFDIVDYRDDATGVTVNLETNSGSGGTAEGDSYSSIEGILGGSGDDVLFGNSSAANYIDGGAGADNLTGGAGDDTFVGGLGADDIDIAAGGSDTLAYKSGEVSEGSDTVTGFQIGATSGGGDVIDIHDVLASTPVSGSVDADALADYVNINQVNSTTVQVQVDPTGNSAFASTLVTLTLTTSETVTLQSLLQQNQIIT